MTSGKTPNYLSLFSGCGGLDQGFSHAGFHSELSVDKDQSAIRVLEQNLKSPTQLLDLSTNDPAIDKKIDVLLAGSPCQGFSTAGHRRIDDPRNTLLFVASRVAEKLKPKVIVAENVPGATAGTHRTLWDELHQKLRAQGYQTGDLRVDSSDHGVAQKRNRIFLIAWNSQKHPSLHLEKRPKKALSTALEKLEAAPNHNPKLLNTESDDFKIATRIGPGQKLTNSRGGESAIHTWDIPEVFGRTNKKERVLLAEVIRLRRQNRRRDYGDADPVELAMLKNIFHLSDIQNLIRKGYLREIGKHVDLTHTFNGKYRRQSMDSQSRTVDTRFGDHRLFLHPTENRGFTVREAARIQGFDDDFIFSGTLEQQYRMIGNAVPPPVAYSVANLVKSLLQG